MKANQLVMTSGEVAKAAMVAPRTVCKWMDNGRLPGYRLPGSQDRRFRRDVVRAFFEQNGLPVDKLDGAAPERVLLVALPDVAAGAVAGHLPPAEGFEVRAVASAFEAGALCATFRPTAVVVDVALGRDAAEHLARAVRADARTGAAMLVLCVHESDDPAAAGAMGFDVGVRSPFDPAAVAKLVRTGAVKETA